MPPAVQDSYLSTPFGAVLDRILERLRAVYTAAGFVRVVANPETRLPEYKAEPGISLWVRTPQPVPKNGRGRNGRLTIRDVVVLITTQSLLDEAGADEIAVRAHVAVEEAVANILDQTPHQSLPYSNRVGILIEWVGGGEDITRRMKSDPGLLYGALVFRVTFLQPMQVYRD